MNILLNLGTAGFLKSSELLTLQPLGISIKYAKLLSIMSASHKTCLYKIALRLSQFLADSHQIM